MQAVYLPIKLLSSFSSKFDISYHQNKDIFTKNYGILYVSPFAPSQPNVMKQEELKIENVAEKGGTLPQVSGRFSITGSGNYNGNDVNTKSEDLHFLSASVIVNVNCDRNSNKGCNAYGNDNIAMMSTRREDSHSLSATVNVNAKCDRNGNYYGYNAYLE